MTRKYTPKDVQYRKGRYLIQLKHGHGARWEEGCGYDKKIYT